MLHNKTHRLCVMLISFLITSLPLNAQSYDKSEKVQHHDCLFEKINLGNGFYLHKITNIPIDPKTHAKICIVNSFHSFDSKTLAGRIPPFELIERSRVNPFNKNGSKHPFKLKFEQNEYSPPIDRDMVITSRFGMRYSGPHRGIDIDLITGDTVRSILPGRVRFVGYSRGHGRTVVVRHANKVETVYAHLSKFLVSENDIIADGDHIGLGGNSGNSRGSHLHLEVRYKGVCIHPEYILKFDGSNSIAKNEIWISRIATTPKLHSSYRKSKIRQQENLEEAMASEDLLPKFHIVKKGDTLSHIARAYSLDINEICTLNSISKKSVLRIGQVIEYR